VANHSAKYIEPVRNQHTGDRRQHTACVGRHHCDFAHTFEWKMRDANADPRAARAHRRRQPDVARRLPRCQLREESLVDARDQGFDIRSNRLRSALI
jgi:hypothetical protein